MKPSYLSLSELEMEDRINSLREKLEDCDICPLECGVDRLSGVARKGLLVRHLVLPEELAGSEEVLRFVAEEISSKAYVNLMVSTDHAVRHLNTPN